MAILAFQKPDKVLMLEADNFFGKFEFRPLEPGYGITIGKALRRILLSSLEGFDITSIKIEGVDHEFGTITGLIYDVTNIILNLKQVRFKHIVDHNHKQKQKNKNQNSKTQTQTKTKHSVILIQILLIFKSLQILLIHTIFRLL